MATYLAFIHDSEQRWDDPANRASGHAAHERFYAAHGPTLTGGAELLPSSQSLTLRPDGDGGVTITDGAFAEAKEVLGGFYVIRAADLRAAADIAREIPVLDGCVVVRGQVDRGGDGPTFLALIHDREELWRDAEAAARGYAGHERFMREHADVIVAGQQLAPTAAATVVRPDGAGGVTLTDGAFAEAKEVLGGYYAFEAPDLDAALAVACDVPVFEGAVELRPAGVITDA